MGGYIHSQTEGNLDYNIADQLGIKMRRLPLHLMFDEAKLRGKENFSLDHMV